MTGTLRLQEPVIIGDRKIWPVVAEVCIIMEHGMTAMVNPVALIMEENGHFTGAVLGDTPLETILDRLIAGEPDKN
ncbi:hypothetical protein [uncultured Methanoregula sp.]|uniref:hypothetical protein n=1 Tax=uncultured Methanoregula sp. TaxID=1005933 RepID=UPI002AAA9834|nr:hypothetical protein [uncultured Methanoregula sp.]